MAKKTQKSATVQIPAPETTADLLLQLTGNSKVAPKKKSERPAIPLSDDQQELVNQYALTKNLFDIFESKNENVTSELKNNLFEKWIDLLWEQKTQPANLNLRTFIKPSKDEAPRPDCEAMFVVQERFKVQGESKEELIDAMVELGLSKENAKNLVEREIDFTPMASVDFNALQKGRNINGEFVPSTPEEQATATKALRLLLGLASDPLTADERKLLITLKPSVQVKEGFYQRLAGYCDSRSNVAAVLKVIIPVQVARGAKVGLSDSMERRSQRLVEFAGGILGVKVSSD